MLFCKQISNQYLLDSASLCGYYNIIMVMLYELPVQKTLRDIYSLQQDHQWN